MKTQPDSAEPRTLQLTWFGFLAAPVAYLVFGWVALGDMTPIDIPQLVTPLLILVGLASVVAGNVAPARFLSARQRPDASREERFAQYRTAMIIRWACFETPAIISLLLVMLGGQAMVLVIGCGVSLALLAQAKPDLKPFTDRSP
jgi:hypothetical protein